MTTKHVEIVEVDGVPGSSRCRSAATWETPEGKRMLVQCLWDDDEHHPDDHRANTRAGRAVVWPKRVTS